MSQPPDDDLADCKAEEIRIEREDALRALKLDPDALTHFHAITADLENAQGVIEAQRGTIADLRRELENRGRLLLESEEIRTGLRNAWAGGVAERDALREANARLDWILVHGYALESEAGRINLSGARETVLAAIDAARKITP